MHAAGISRAAALITALLVAASPAGATTTLAIAGSTTLLPFVREAAEVYQSSHPEVTVNVTGGGSRSALEQLAQREIDVAATDTATNNDDFVDHKIAVIAFAFAVNPASGVTTLTREQLRGILTGAIKNFKAIGGGDVPLVVVNRPASSGLRTIVERQIMRGRAIAETGLVDDATSAVVADVKAAPGGLGYGSVGALRDAGLTLLSIGGTSPTSENVANGTYPLWAYEHLVTYGPASLPASRFLAFIETNRTLLTKYGYIPIADMKVP